MNIFPSSWHISIRQSIAHDTKIFELLNWLYFSLNISNLEFFSIQCSNDDKAQWTLHFNLDFNNQMYKSFHRLEWDKNWIHHSLHNSTPLSLSTHYLNVGPHAEYTSIDYYNWIEDGKQLNFYHTFLFQLWKSFVLCQN